MAPREGTRARSRAERASRAQAAGSRVPIDRRVPRRLPRRVPQKRATPTHVSFAPPRRFDDGLDDGLGGVLGGGRLGGCVSGGVRWGPGRGVSTSGAAPSSRRGRGSRGREARTFEPFQDVRPGARRAASRAPRDAARGDCRARWIFAIARARGSPGARGGMPTRARVGTVGPGKPSKTPTCRRSRASGARARGARTRDAPPRSCAALQRTSFSNDDGRVRFRRR